MVRFDKCGKQDNVYEVSINLDPQQRGKGLGRLLLTKAIEHFWTQVADADLILAEIKKENAASKKAFENAGFEEREKSATLYEFSLSRR